MNKHCFRLIFSKTLGFLIPVAEITRAQRKPGQTACNPPPVPSRSSVFSLKHLAASMLLAGLSGYAFAQLIVDPSAGETNVIAAPNGVPVIEIANPNGNGLSHNRFTEFDVQKPGVIFNNSQVNGQSQLGGTILRNPNLQRPATAILSEVTGNKPSSISGTLEVFGGRADILIAKPNRSSAKDNASRPSAAKPQRRTQEPLGRLPDLSQAPAAQQADEDSRSTLSPPPTPRIRPADPEIVVHLPASPSGSEYNYRDVPPTPGKSLSVDERSVMSNQSFSEAENNPERSELGSAIFPPDSDLASVEAYWAWRATSVEPQPHDVSASKRPAKRKPSLSTVGADAKRPAIADSDDSLPPTPRRQSPRPDSDMSMPSTPQGSEYSYRELPATPRWQPTFDESPPQSPWGTAIGSSSLDSGHAQSDKTQLARPDGKHLGDDGLIQDQAPSYRSDLHSMPTFDQLVSGEYADYVKEIEAHPETQENLLGEYGTENVTPTDMNPSTVITASDEDSFIFKKPAPVKKSANGRRITAQDMNTWNEMPYTDQVKAKGVRGYLKSNGINPHDASFLTRTGISRQGYERLLRLAKNERAGSLITKAQIEEWAGLTDEQRKEIGGVAGFSESRKIALVNAKKYINIFGLTHAGRSRVSKEKATVITYDQVKEWDGFSPEQRKEIGGVAGFAQSRKIKFMSADKHLSSNGLTAWGRDKLSRSQNSTITADQIKEWMGFSAAQRQEVGGVAGFAASRKIKLSSADRYINLSGITAAGKNKLLRSNNKPISNEQIREWSEFSAEQKEAVGGLNGFAESRKISTASVYEHLSAEGLRARGEARLTEIESKPITVDQIREWDGYSSEEKLQVGGIGGFAALRKITISSALNHLTASGLRNLGKGKLLEDQSSPISNDHIKEWIAMSPEQRKKIGGVSGFALLRKIKMSSAFSHLKIGGLRPRGMNMLAQDKTPTGKSLMEALNSN